MIINLRPPQSFSPTNSHFATNMAHNSVTALYKAALSPANKAISDKQGKATNVTPTIQETLLGKAYEKSFKKAVLQELIIGTGVIAPKY